MATKKEIEEHLNIALKEIGKIKPWFDDNFNIWLFNHPLYPIDYAGESVEEVIKNYPLYLKEFIKHRLNENLNPLTEKETKGRGGKREGAGRPKGTFKEHKTRIYVPDDIAKWIKHPQSIAQVRRLMHRKKVG